MQRSRLVLLTATLSACFSPEVSTEPTDTEAGDDGSGSSGPTGGATDPTSSPSGTSESVTDSAEGTGDETGSDPDTTAGDAPPIFESFEVNGSTEPAEVDEGGTIDLEANVSDDVGVVSVEFFDGETSLGVVENSPYELEVPVSSADSGSHTFTAVATDTADQTTESDEVVLSVNIVGGQVEQLREQLFRGSDGLALVNGGLNASMDDRVFLSAILEGGGSSRVMAFNDGLSQLWTQTYEERTPGGPVYVDGTVFIGGADPDALDLVYRALSPDSGQTLESHVVETTATVSGHLLFYGRVARSGDNVVVHDSLANLAAYDSTFAERQWLANLPAAVAVADTASHTFVSFGDADEECATGANYCVRRYDTNGSSTWTVGLPADFPAVLATTPDGGVFAAVGFSDPGFEVFRIGPTGELESMGQYGTENPSYLSAAHSDGAGGLVVAGADGEYSNGRAFVTHIAADGSVGWDQRQFFNNSVDSAALDVVVDAGDVYVYGLANNESNFLDFVGDAWVARVSL